MRILLDMVSTARRQSEVRKVDDKIVVQYRNDEYGCWVFAAYEPTALGAGTHFTVTTFDGFEGWYGAMGQRRGIQAASAAGSYETWRAALEAECYEVILKAFPEAGRGIRGGGEIELELPYEAEVVA